MEVKLQCDCGQKYKFDVEPVQGRMPYEVKCPVCGADGTARANVILLQHLPTQSSAVAPPPVAVAPPPPKAAQVARVIPPLPPPPTVRATNPPPPPPPPAPMRVAGFGANRPAAAAPPPVPPAFTPLQSGAADEAEPEETEPGRVREITLGWKTWSIVGLVILLVIGGSYKKWSKRVTFVKDLVNFISEISSAGSGLDSADDHFYTSREETVFSEDSYLLLIQATNHAAVAQAITDYWSEHSKERLTSMTITNYDQVGDNARFLVLPERQGGVQVDVDYISEEQSAKAIVNLTQALSRQLGTRAVCEVMDLAEQENTDSYTTSVIIYQSGEKKFQLDQSVRFRGQNVKMTAKVTGEKWAQELGFKPGDKGFAEFSMEDAEKLAQLAGFQPAGPEPIKECLLLETKLPAP